MNGKKDRTDFGALSDAFDDVLGYVEGLPDIPKESHDPFTTAKPGDYIAGEGVYLGKWEPKDLSGVSLRKIFNVFAAPEDLTNRYGNKTLYTYLDANDRIADLRKWHGYDGVNYIKDAYLYKALQTGNYQGQWVMPPLELVAGLDRFGNQVQGDNLARHSYAGAFNETLAKETFENKGYHQWYWSCTQSFTQPDLFWSTQLGDKGESRAEPFLINNGLASCRPVRLVEVKP